MSNPKSRINYGMDAKLHDEFVEAFNRVYEANNKPDGMAMYAHNDSFGALMGVSITPQSIPHCPFSANWSEIEKAGEFGHVGWVAGDVRLKLHQHTNGALPTTFRPLRNHCNTLKSSAPNWRSLSPPTEAQRRVAKAFPDDALRCMDCGNSGQVLMAPTNGYG